MTDRIKWIDNARAIGILLVVLGHLDGLSVWIKKTIYAFHMPLFFFISGYLFKDEYLNYSFKDFFVKKIFALLVPYYFFGLISFPFFLVAITSHSIPGSVTIYGGLVGFLAGIRNNLWVNTALWFFIALFCCTVLFFLTYKSFKKFTLFVIFILFIINNKLAYNPYLSIFCIDVSVNLLIFFSIGFYFKKFNITTLLLKSNFNLISSLAILLVLFGFSVSFNTYVDFFQLKMGNFLVTFVSAITGSMLISIISHVIPYNLIFNLLSKNSIVIFPIHMKIFGVLTFLLIGFWNIDSALLSTFNFQCIYFFCGIFFPLIFGLIIRKIMPWAIGYR